MRDLASLAERTTHSLVPNMRNRLKHGPMFLRTIAVQIRVYDNEATVAQLKLALPIIDAPQEYRSPVRSQ